MSAPPRLPARVASARRWRAPERRPALVILLVAVVAVAAATPARAADAPPPGPAPARSGPAAAGEGPLASAEPAPSAGAAPDRARKDKAEQESQEERKRREEQKKQEGREDESWLDVGHSFVEHRLFAPVLRLDRFFSDERDLEEERARSFIRWRNEIRFDEDSSMPKFSTGISASLRLPGLQKQLRRLRVEIAGETREAFTRLFGPDQAAFGETPAERNGRADAGIAFKFLETVIAHGDLGAGVILRLPPGVYGRARIRSVIPLGGSFLSREALTGFWRTDTRFGSSASGEIERPLGRMTVARILGTGTVTEVSRGVEWLSDVALLATYDPYSGAQFGASVNGATDPVAGTPGIDRYRIYTRLRRDFYQRWIFLEMEPEVAWPWTFERGRHPAWGIALRLELQFHGTEASP